MPFIAPFFSAVVNKQGIHLVLMKKREDKMKVKPSRKKGRKYNSHISLSAFRLMVLGS
jgi:hypothetical protein